MARKVGAREVLRLLESGMSRNAIARSRGVSRHGVQAVSEAAEAAGVGWAEAEGMSDAEAYALLFPERAHDGPVYPDPDWERVHRELARVGVTLKRLHEECRDGQGSKGGPLVSYDRLCERCRGFTVRRQVVGRAGHGAGRILEVDWAGPTMPLVDPAAGEVSKVFLSAARPPFSRPTYVEPTLGMGEDAWPRCHVHAFACTGGSTPCIVPDNLKAGVTRHPREGEVEPSEAYREMAARYGSAAMPARVAAPRDEPSAENEARRAAPETIAALRDEVLTDFSQLKGAVAERLEEHSSRPLSRREGTRREAFEGRGRPLLRPLPAVPYEACERACGRKARRNRRVAHKRDCHSVGHLAVGRTVDLRVTDATAGVFLAALGLERRHARPRLERACATALASGLPSPRHRRLKPILETNRDLVPGTRADDGGPGEDEAGCVRGAGFYGEEA